MNGFPVSKETLVLRRWERSKQIEFDFIQRVDKGLITTVKGLEIFLNVSKPFTVVIQP